MKMKELDENEDREEDNNKIRRTRWKELKMKIIGKDLGIRVLMELGFGN